MKLSLRTTFLFLFVTTIFWVGGANAQNSKIVGRVAAVVGDVTVIANQSSSAQGNVKVLQKTMALYEGDIVKTGQSGRVKIVFIKSPKGKSNEIVLGGGTDLVLKRAFNYESNKKGTVLLLRQGSVRSRVNERYSATGDDIYEVRTPSVVAGVRGTVFQVEYDSQTKKAAVATLEGRVAVHPKGDLTKMRVVNAGMFVLGQSRALNKPSKINSDSVMKQRLQDFDSREQGLNEGSKEQQSGISILPKNSYGIADDIWNENLEKRGYSNADLQNARLKGAAQQGVVERQDKRPASGDAGFLNLPVAQPKPATTSAPVRGVSPIQAGAVRPQPAQSINSSGVKPARVTLPARPLNNGRSNLPHSVVPQSKLQKFKSNGGLD